MKEKLFTKNYILMIVISALAFIASFMITATSAQHCIAIGGTKATAGFLTSAYTLSAFATRPIWGSLSDNKGRKSVFYIGGIMCAAAIGLLFITRAMWLLFLSRIIFGAGVSGITTSSGTMVSDIIPKSRFSNGIAFYGISNVLSQAVAPALALYLYDFGFGWVLAVVLVLIICSAVGIIFVRYNEKSLLKKENEEKSFSLIEKKGVACFFYSHFYSPELGICLCIYSDFRR